MTSLSENGKVAVTEKDSDKRFSLLLTLDHDALSQPVRVIDDNVAMDENGNRIVVSQGREFVCFPFEIDLPSQDPDRPQETMITIDDIESPDPDVPKVSEIAESFVTPATATLEGIFTSDPDIIDLPPITMMLADTTIDGGTVTGRLTGDDGMGTEPIPGDIYDPANNPALHK